MTLKEIIKIIGKNKKILKKYKNVNLMGLLVNDQIIMLHFVDPNLKCGELGDVVFISRGNK